MLTMTESFVGNEFVSDTAVVTMDAYQAQSHFNHFIAKGYESLRIGAFADARNMLAMAVSISLRVITMLSKRSTVRPLHSWRKAPLLLKQAIDMAVVKDRNAKRKLSRSKPLSSDSDADKAKRVGDRIKQVIGANRHGLAFKLVARYHDLIVLYAPTLLIQLSDDVAKQLAELEGSLETAVKQLVGANDFQKALNLLATEAYRNCRNKRRMRKFILNAETEATGKLNAQVKVTKTKKVNGTHPHGSPQGHMRGPYQRRDGIFVRRHAVNMHLIRVKGALVWIDVNTQQVVRVAVAEEVKEMLSNLANKTSRETATDAA